MNQGVWYVAYGSNLCRARFLAYITGSDGSIWPRTRGCRDKTLPTKAIAKKILGGLYFARRSTNWNNGGVAFFDPTDVQSEVAVRCYLLRRDQFCDVFLQENGREMEIVWDAFGMIQEGNSIVLSSGWYSEIIRLPDIDGEMALTLTSPIRAKDATHVKPASTYLEIFKRGLGEAHGLSDLEATEYLEKWIVSGGK